MTSANTIGSLHVTLPGPGPIVVLGPVWVPYLDFWTVTEDGQYQRHMPDLRVVLPEGSRPLHLPRLASQDPGATTNYPKSIVEALLPAIRTALTDACCGAHGGLAPGFPVVLWALPCHVSPDGIGPAHRESRCCIIPDIMADLPLAPRPELDKPNGLRIRTEDLLRLEQVLPGSTWTHHKHPGSAYRVLDVALWEPDKTPMVTYRATAGWACTWARPMDQFCDGRFIPINSGHRALGGDLIALMRDALARGVNTKHD